MKLNIQIIQKLNCCTKIVYRFQRAINDCTSSLKLDNTYVKTYQRRSAAFMALEMYNEAKNDLNEILKLEPNNKQAKLDMEFVNNKMKQVGRIYYVNPCFRGSLLTKNGVNY